MIKDLDSLLYLCEEFASLGETITGSLRTICDPSEDAMRSFNPNAVPFLIDFLEECAGEGGRIEEEANAAIKRINRMVEAMKRGQWKL